VDATARNAFVSAGTGTTCDTCLVRYHSTQKSIALRQCFFNDLNVIFLYLNDKVTWYLDLIKPTCAPRGWLVRPGLERFIY